MADGTTKRIDEIKVGDEIANSEPEDRTTPESHRPRRAHHRGRQGFCSASSHEWVDAAELTAGEQLATPGNGRATVHAVHGYLDSLRTYNLTIEAVHTYYVLAGDTPVLVHNTGPCKEKFTSDQQKDMATFPGYRKVKGKRGKGSVYENKRRAMVSLGTSVRISTSTWAQCSRVLAELRISRKRRLEKGRMGSRSRME